MAIISRGRGLAAAVGIGAALTAGAGVAWADADADAGSPGHSTADAASSSADADPGGSTGSAAAGPQTNERSGTSDSEATDQSGPEQPSANAGDDGADGLVDRRKPSKSDPGVETADTEVTTISDPADEQPSSRETDPPSTPTDTPLTGLVYAAARRESVDAPATHRATATVTAEKSETSADTEPAGLVAAGPRARGTTPLAEPVGLVAAGPTSADITETVPATGAATVSATVTTKTVTPTATPVTVTSLVEQFLYLPIHFIVEAWINSDIGRVVDGIVNTLAGSYVIGDGADGTADHPDGGSGGWLLGDGGDGWTSTLAGVAGGAGGAAGLFGDGGLGGGGGAGTSGGAGGSGGWLMGIGGSGGAGGAGADGGVGGAGGAGGDARALLFGVGGGGGRGGNGSDGGRGGTGGDGAAVLGRGGDGGDAGDSGIGCAATALPALGGAGGNAGSLGSHGSVGRSGTGGIGSWSDVTEDSGTSLLTVTANGSWLTTADGRVVILHGANEVYKVGSYAPADAGFDADDAEFLAANGFNVVRLGMIWAAVEPEPGVFDHDYLVSIAQTVQVLADHGIYTVLDMHQDNYSTTFGGEGAPEWATQTGGLPNVDYGFPWNYFLNAAEGHAWDAFWSNAETPTGLGLEDEYARTWETVASYFTGNSAVIGYDIMNEPFEGSGWPAALLGSTFFAEQQLAPMYNQVIAAIRAVDPTTAIFVEPTPATYELGALLGRSLVMGTIDDSNVVAAVHNYCYGSATTGICSWIADTVAAKAQAYSVQHQIPIFMGEFGASDIVTDLTAGMNAADRYFTGWTVWSYSGKGDITTAGPTDGESLVYDPALPPTGDNVNTSNLVTLAAPYPQLVAGTPHAWSFTGGTLTFSYSTEKVDGSGSFAAGSQTTISVPAVEYPHGYQVSVTGGHVVSVAGAPLLVIASDPGASTVSVVVSGATVVSDVTGEAV